MVKNMIFQSMVNTLRQISNPVNCCKHRLWQVPMVTVQIDFFYCFNSKTTTEAQWADSLLIHSLSIKYKVANKSEYSRYSVYVCYHFS